MSTRQVLVAVACLCVAAGGSARAASAESAAAATDLYVATDGSDTNACTTKVEPCHTISHAIALAAPSGTTVHVAAGIYGSVTPGNKHVTVVGAGRNLDSGTIINSLVAVRVDDPAGALTLKSLAVGGNPVGADVTDGVLKTSHASIAESPCGLFMTGGSVTLTDSLIEKSGITDPSDCSSFTSTPAAATVNGGTLAMVRSKLVDTKDEPGIVVNSGTFTATDSEFSDLTYEQSKPAVSIAGGAATISRSLFQADFVGLEVTGGSTTVTDSTFNRDEFGIFATGAGGSTPAVFRSSLVDAALQGPARLAGDVLTNQFGAACSEEPTDLGYNYGTRGSCTFNAPTSRNGVTTLNLDAVVADHGGPTPTVAMAAPSALINAIPADATWGPEHRKLCPQGITDERGVSRPQGGGCDVGAFEAAATRTALTAKPDPAAPGAKMTLTAKITPHAGTFHDPDPVKGKVTFKTGKTVLCTDNTVSDAGLATCATTQLPAGKPTLTAAFASTSPYLNSADARKVVVGTRPRFTTADHATATIGKHKAITIRASAAPAPTITKLSGALPKGMKFVSGSGRATISGTPARGTAQKYVLRLRAANVRARAAQRFTLTVVTG